VLKKLSRQALHAGRLSFLHPATGEKMAFESPLPEDMDEVIEFLRGKAAEK
jgi:23S rRNA pseudouridine1911/1915/1917 synthase